VRLSCREEAVLENVGAGPDEEQTWPTEEEMAAARPAAPPRRLPPGTSDYQACWIVDDDDAVSDGEDAPEATPAGAAADGTAPGRPVESTAGGDVDADMEGASDIEGGDEGSEAAASAEEVRRIRRERRRHAEEEDLQYPDEVEVPPDVNARVRGAPCACFVHCWLRL
jgi:pre-rRNA-processing protein TSR1